MGFSYVARIVTDPSQVGASSLTDFPMLVSGTYHWLASSTYGGQVTNANGYDIGFFEDEACTLTMAWEVERYVARTGEVEFWVKVPNLYNNVPVTIYMAWGNPSVTTDQSTPTSVWDSNYKAVYHLGDGTTLSGADSVGVNNGTLTNTPTATTGQVAGGGLFAAASSQYIDLGADTSIRIAGAITIEAWVKQTTLDASLYRRIVSNLTGSPYNGWELIIAPTSASGIPRLQVATAGTLRNAGGGVVLVAGTWYHLVATYNGTTGTIYVNASTVSSSTFTAASAIGSSSLNPRIGSWPGGAANNYQNGAIDEVRISNTARSAGYVTASYNNQKAGSTFYTLQRKARRLNAGLRPHPFQP